MVHCSTPRDCNASSAGLQSPDIHRRQREPIHVRVRRGRPAAVSGTRATSPAAASPRSCTSPRAWGGPCSSRGRRASARPSWPRRWPRSPSRPLIRLQCYEGLDEGKALYEWKYAKQLLYTQLLRERIGELIADAPSLPDAVVAHRRPGRRLLLLPLPVAAPAAAAIQSPRRRSCCSSTRSTRRSRSSRRSCSRCCRTSRCRCPSSARSRRTHIPLVVLTSNNARELSDGLKRRCLHLFIDFPAPAEELEIIRLKVPEIPERLARAVVAAVQKIRAHRPAQAAVGLGVARLGALARDPERQGARRRARGVDAHACS